MPDTRQVCHGLWSSKVPLPLHKCSLNTNKEKKQEEQMVKQSIFAILMGLLYSHLSYIINHHPTSEFLHATVRHNDYTSISFPVTLWPWVQGHSNWNQNVEFSTKIETKQFTRVLTHDYVKCIFQRIMSTQFSPWILLAPSPQKELQLQQTNRLWQHSDFHPNQHLNLREIGHRDFWCLTHNYGLQRRSRSSKTDIKI